LFVEDSEGTAQRKHVLPKKVINKLAEEGQINYNTGQKAQTNIDETIQLHFNIKRSRKT
jgi:hypothetical protein